MKQPHILCSKEEVAEYVLLPGDPKRVSRVAQCLDTWEEIASNREFKTISGYYKDVPVTITSTGIGGASTAIAIEELIACGGKYFIRIGSGGAVQKNVKIGDLVIATAAVREDGASKMYIAENYPAVADFRLTTALVDICQGLEYNYHTGIVRSHDSFYIDEEEALMEFWNKKRVLASDMETATLFTVAQLRGVFAASVLNNVVNYQEDTKEGIKDYVYDDKSAAEGEKREIFVALEAIYHLYQKELAVSSLT